jgi:hypothetical protein
MTYDVDRGRPLKHFLAKAIDMIRRSDEPLSTTQLIKHLALDHNESLVLRRGLRRAQERNEIREVGVHQDKSLTWLAGDMSIARCAGHAANLFLDRESPGKRIDPEEFESWILNEKPLQS